MVYKPNDNTGELLILYYLEGHYFHINNECSNSICSIQF